MLGKNVDFVAVLVISLVMLAFGWVRASHWQEAIDSIRIEPAIHIERCPLTTDFLSRLTCILPR
jgi:hypothetical protein